MPNHSLLEEIKSKKIKFNGVSSDSRSIKKGNIFFAIPGNEIDGSRFINQAIKKGAAAIVVPSYSKERYPKNLKLGTAQHRRINFGSLAYTTMCNAAILTGVDCLIKSEWLSNSLRGTQ